MAPKRASRPRSTAPARRARARPRAWPDRPADLDPAFVAAGLALEREDELVAGLRGHGARAAAGRSGPSACAARTGSSTARRRAPACSPTRARNRRSSRASRGRQARAAGAAARDRPAEVERVPRDGRVGEEILGLDREHVHVVARHALGVGPIEAEADVAPGAKVALEAVRRDGRDPLRDRRGISVPPGRRNRRASRSVSSTSSS